MSRSYRTNNRDGLLKLLFVQDTLNLRRRIIEGGVRQAQNQGGLVNNAWSSKTYPQGIENIFTINTIPKYIITFFKDF